MLMAAIRMIDRAVEFTLFVIFLAFTLVGGLQIFNRFVLGLPLQLERGVPEVRPYLDGVPGDPGRLPLRRPSGDGHGLPPSAGRGAEWCGS